MLIFNPLNYPTTYLTPDRLTDIESWQKLIPFAFFLVEYLEPKLVVELGSHKGDSYSAFCQAVDHLNLNCRCFAVDSWRGDSQAGFYGNEVYEDFRTYHDKKYSKFSTLVRSTFDDAVSRFKDNSIDILHIDGHHTYDAVKHDYMIWVNKVSDNGIILFHDVMVNSPGFGVRKLWDEIIVNYDGFILSHSNGLGVLIKKINNLTEVLLDFYKQDGALMQRHYELLGEAVMVRRIRKNICEEKSNALKNIQYRDERIAELGESLESEKNNASKQIEYRESLLSLKENEIKQNEIRLKELQSKFDDYIACKETELERMEKILNSGRFLLSRLLKLVLTRKKYESVNSSSN